MLSQEVVAVDGVEQEFVLNFDAKTTKKITSLIEYEQKNTQRRWVVGACFGNVTPRVLAEMKMYMAFMREQQREPDIYFEEQDSQPRQEWGEDVEAMLVDLYSDVSVRNNKVRSIYEMRLDPEWIKLHNMLSYLLESSPEIKSRLGEGLTDREKAKLSNDNIQRDLLAQIEREAVNFVENRRKKAIPVLEDAVIESKKHFSKNAIDFLYWMSHLDADKSEKSSKTEAETVVFHLHCLPTFVIKVINYAHIFGRNKYSVHPMTMSFDPKTHSAAASPSRSSSDEHSQDEAKLLREQLAEMAQKVERMERRMEKMDKMEQEMFKMKQKLARAEKKPKRKLSPHNLNFRFFKLAAPTVGVSFHQAKRIIMAR